MTRTAATKTYANFTAGFITEANELSYPENAAIDIDNLIINEDGSVQRRPGLAFDGDTSVALPALSNSIAETATTIHKWSSVNGVPGRDIAVIQMADRLDFYYIRGEDILSGTPAAPSLILTAPSSPSASTKALRESNDVTITTGGGRLYVAGKFIDPFVLTFNEPAIEWDTGSVDKEDLILKIRDFEIAEEDVNKVIDGTDYSIAGQERQRFMSGAHFYNLANQGWSSVDNGSGFLIEDTDTDVSLESNPDNGTTSTGPALWTDTKVGFFPTTQHLFHTYQAGGGVSITEQTAYSPWFLGNDYLGTSASPRGRIIQEAFNIERKAIGDLSNTIVDDTPYLSDLTYDESIQADFRPTAIAFYSGRVWYAGMEGTRYTNNIYYSQVIGDDIKKASKCYQEADPTAEVINELVATDGGLLSLEEVGKVLGLIPIGSSLVVIADNGVWTISGDQEFSSFKADSFSIRRVTNQGAINKDSIVFARDILYYFSKSSIVAVGTDQTGGVLAEDISSPRIRGFYQDILAGVSNKVFSVFDEGSNRIFWFYLDDEESIFDNIKSKAFNKALYWDLSLSAFGKHSAGIQETILPVAGLSVEVANTFTVQEDVTDSNVVVTDSAVDVFVENDIFISERSSVKFLTLENTGTWGYRLSSLKNIDTYDDWGTDFVSYLETGFDSLQDVITIGKKAPMLQTHFKRTEDGFELDENLEIVLSNQSSCNVSYGWDWETSPYSSPFQAYRLLRNYTPSDVTDPFDYDLTVISTRNRIRGRGTSLGLRFESEAGKNFILLGYGIVYTNRNRA